MSDIWSQEEVDIMLNAVLCIDKESTYKNDSMLSSFFKKRSAEAIRSMVWKLATEYRKQADYQPGPLRLSREGKSFTWVEKYIFEQGFKSKSHHLARVMMRHEDEINKYRDDVVARGRSSFNIFQRKG